MTTIRLASKLLPGVVGAALLSVPAAYYRIDRVSCASWPSPTANVLLVCVYLVAVALLAICWRSWWTARPSLGAALVAGALVHAVALLAPPFLSTDPLFYAAVGRAMARYHASAYAPLRTALPAGDPLLRALSVEWQGGTSAYFPGWNQLARLVAWIAGDALWMQLRLHQVIGAAATLSAAGLVGVAERTRDPERAGSAAAAVLFCPLAIVEATVGAHNDALLMLSVALLVLATVRERPLAAVAAAASGLAIKASALLLAGFDAIALIAARLRIRAGYLAVAALAAGAAAAMLTPRFTDLVNPHTLQCERAIECVPRWLLWQRGHFRAAFAVGVAFRIAGALWLLQCALRAGRQRQLLPWLATGLFVYYLYFHAYVQAWYLLPLLPLLPFADARARPAMVAASVTWVGHYAVMLPFNCRASSTEIWIERAVGLALVLLLPTALLLRRRRA